MWPIDTADAAPVPDPVPAAGKQGFFTEGNPFSGAGGIDATTVPAWFLNMLQAELVAICKDAGIALDKQNNAQVLGAIKKIIQNKAQDLTPYLKKDDAKKLYLELAGGTLTGSLSGTTADFSGLVTVKNPDDVPGQKTGNNVATTFWADKHFQSKGNYIKTDDTDVDESIASFVINKNQKRAAFYDKSGNFTFLANLDDLKTEHSVGDIKWRITDRTPPAGDWIPCYGQEFDNNVYPELRDVLAKQDLQDNLIPDLRGRYVKSFGSWTPNPGQTQEDAIREIKGNAGPFRGYLGNWQSGGAIGFYGAQTVEMAHSGKNDMSQYIDFYASRVVPTAEENRPKTFVLVAYIKAR